MGDADPEPTTSKERKHEEKVIAKPKTSNQARHRGSKRPDKPLYMPRAVRERLSLQNTPQPPEDKTLTSPAAGCCTCRSSESFMPETTKSSPTATQEHLNAADCVHKYLDDSPALGTGEVLEPPLLSLANMTLGNDEDMEPSSVSCTDLTEEVNLLLALLTLFDSRASILKIKYGYCVCPDRLRRT